LGCSAFSPAVASTDDRFVSAADSIYPGIETRRQSADLEFPPIPRPPSVVEPIRKKLEARAEARKVKMQRKETPLRERVSGPRHSHA